jgi:hypothetical protein
MDEYQPGYVVGGKTAETRVQTCASISSMIVFAVWLRCVREILCDYDCQGVGRNDSPFVAIRN